MHERTARDQAAKLRIVVYNVNIGCRRNSSRDFLAKTKSGGAGVRMTPQPPILRLVTGSETGRPRTELRSRPMVCVGEVPLRGIAGRRALRCAVEIHWCPAPRLASARRIRSAKLLCEGPALAFELRYAVSGAVLRASRLPHGILPPPDWPDATHSNSTGDHNVRVVQGRHRLLSVPLCRDLCRNPAIPARVGLCQMVSLRNR
jgi:hypothetical protein